MTRRVQRPARPRRGPLHAVDDQLLVAELLGPAAGRRLLAAAELARRFQPASVPPAALDRPRDYLPHLTHLRGAPAEILGVLALDAWLALLDGCCQVASGAVMHVSVTPREVFTPAIERRAGAIVLAHNTPPAILLRARTIAPSPR
jgi:DNA repair protein RadC